MKIPTTLFSALLAGMFAMSPRRILLASALLVSVVSLALAQELSFTALSEQSLAAVAPPAKAWAARYNSAINGVDQARALAIDDSGNVFVTGSSAYSGDAADYLTIKYNNAGVKQWIRRYDGPSKRSDDAVAIAVDAAGNVYVTGTSRNTNYTGDFVTIKYNRAGDKQWGQRYNGPANANDVAKAMAVDDSGNVYVTGSSFAFASGIDYVTIKYNCAGFKQWVACYNASGASYDEPCALAVDKLGNVYVTGYSIVNDNADYVTVKYDHAGLQKWVARDQGMGKSYDEARALAVDDSGNVYVTGTGGGVCTCKLNYVTIKYNSSGNLQWKQVYDGPDRLQDTPNAMVVDKAGNVYVAGASQDSTYATWYATVKYNRAGVKQWGARHKGPGGTNIARALAVDSLGNVYVLGYSTGSSPNDDYLAIRYNSAGVKQWSVRYNGPANGDDRACGMALDGAGNLYLTGSSNGANGLPDYATIKYVPSDMSTMFPPIAREDGPMLPQSLPTTFNLLQNYPNPLRASAFNPGTTIRFDTPSAGRVKLAVYTLRGELAQTLVDGEMAAGAHQVHFDGRNLASGFYFYRMETDTYIMTRKMILQK